MRATVYRSDGIYPPSRGITPGLTRLGLGILAQAFRDLLARNKASDKDWRQWQADARDWFFCEDTDPGSLDWVCSLLKLDPGVLRRWILSYQNSHPSRQKILADRMMSSFRFRVQESQDEQRPIDLPTRVC